MNTQETIALGQLVATSIVGISGVILSLSVYRLSSRQREDAWQKHFAEIHERFWQDQDFQVVRTWLACPDAYREIGEILKKRRDEQLMLTISPAEYVLLDKLDKYLNLMVRIVELEFDTKSHHALLDGLFFTYWLRRSIEQTADDSIHHEEFYWYVERFYPSIIRHVKTLND